MRKKIINKFLLLLFICSIPAVSSASLLDTANPYFTKTIPLGRNPARGAFLKENNKLHLAGTISEELTYNEMLLKNMTEYNTPYWGEVALAAETMFSDTYVNFIAPIPHSSLYLGATHFSSKLSCIKEFSPTTDSKPLSEAYDNFYDSYYYTGTGLTASLPILNNMLYIGFEALESVDLHSYVHETNDKTSRITNYRYTAQSWPYYVYTLGAIFPVLNNTNIFTASYTAASMKHYKYTRVYKNYADPLDNITIDLEYNYYPASVLGLGYIFNLNNFFQLGFSSEFFSNAISTDEEGILLHPYTRNTLAIENAFSNIFSARLYGSIIKNKDARTNQFDNKLYNDQFNYQPDDNEPNIEDRYIFTEEHFGLDLVFNAMDKAYISIGTNLCNYVYDGSRSPYGIDAVIRDLKSYVSVSIPGILQSLSAKPAPASAKWPEETLDKNLDKELEEDENSLEEEPLEADDLELGDAEKELADEEDTLPQPTTPARSNMGETVDVSSTSVFPGTDISITIHEGNKKIFKASVIYTIKNRAYKYPLYQADQNTWKTTIPISPLTESGTYQMKLYKVYDDATMEMKNIEFTVNNSAPAP